MKMNKDPNSIRLIKRDHNNSTNGLIYLPMDKTTIFLNKKKKQTKKIKKKKKKKKKTDILLPHRDLPPAASFSEPPCEMGTEQS